MATEINDPVQVQARTIRGKLQPYLLTWRQKPYHISEIKQRRVVGEKGNQSEIITASMLDVRSIRLAFNRKKKEWTLLSID